MSEQLPEAVSGEDESVHRSRAIYILPNLFTSAALFCGFYAIVQAMNDRFDLAAVAIFIAMVLDGLDGRVARLTNTQSAFGAEYDSLSDMVAFGVAPALVIYEWSMKDLGKLGWMAAFLYCVCAALRLARFNTNIAVVDKRYFQGLPSPAAAALVTGFIWIMIDNGETGLDHLLGIPVPYLAWFFAVFAGLSMVSNVLFWSGKSINLRRAVPFSVALAFIAVLLAVHYDPPVMLFLLFVTYAMSGYVMSLWRVLRRYRAQRGARPS
ncbi:MAG: CDP-diacylglycerol--serine O-phosphatidyltransferase [Candidatus Dactylopiibacterium carminicum]|uniref:CDP-diacylglycerol--serine O-phosphatidyltransferase n=1 Tax=Candidatus Dactylopiibacterium carminicum TaxID=857335 RepID=A0A272EYZ1_9RHOO|nr:CDP-diacylglycerol--serine O-phosphatidyltransferase [Candidatus Dactylopiibacterium carminicum]KAF7600848.1 CDP-diacylglycerol--serine O-phosphatidyltransferase [Candidatus Dactylopiibacterium carminicum]PAS95347.1 MAG: CDP-diacylglycerol--serine O-phosphatidyltransferase [Candidatus Dactylopiibacterium carminicum]PAS98642.1 MAG: CDP-diacylglycerol--serine O-phosphatidyltransferase [Candidatus Dactylopiibacterium carminicum]PAT00852.1 MAG: CDP-diacylglycerol--serine O-phosphatidyltransferas